ncbi:hypothetical protein M758_UG233300 [Ceratodon purpureus]|nr:hypothetical protein M758_UG233300 [Ceratodon purpureus]
MKDDIGCRFTFDPPLKEGYIIDHIENSLRTTRYQWRKFWVITRRGEKHRKCPEKFFPALDKYWRTRESEEESRKMTEVRAAARNSNRNTKGDNDLGSTASEDTWDLVVDEDPEYLKWDDIETGLEYGSDEYEENVGARPDAEATYHVGQCCFRHAACERCSVTTSGCNSGGGGQNI